MPGSYESPAVRDDHIVESAEVGIFIADDGPGIKNSLIDIGKVELAVDADRHCPHCGKPGAVSRRQGRGLRRYQCEDLSAHENSTPLPARPCPGFASQRPMVGGFGGCLARGPETVRASADHCNLAAQSHGIEGRWRHRFLEAAKKAPQKLKGIVEVDETYVLESHKGQLSNPRPQAPQKRRQFGWLSAACRANRCRF